ncbi:MAG: hypothetical protein ACJ8FO_04880 [Sphingomicrobium sp.]
MDARLIDRIESSVEHTASLLFAAAVAYAVYRLAGVPDPQLLAFALAALATAYLLSMRTLASVSSQNNDFRVSIFDPREIEAQGPDELLLTAEDRLHDASELLLTEADRLDASELLLTDRLEALSVAPAPLVLDDVLTQINGDSRVVRLFDPKLMPTPGQLKSQIDSHLGHGSPAGGASDASQALSDALAELRRSLR